MVEKNTGNIKDPVTAKLHVELFVIRLHLRTSGHLLGQIKASKKYPTELSAFFCVFPHPNRDQQEDPRSNFSSGSWVHLLPLVWGFHPLNIWTFMPCNVNSSGETSPGLRPVFLTQRNHTEPMTDAASIAGSCQDTPFAWVIMASAPTIRWLYHLKAGKFINIHGLFALWKGGSFPVDVCG